MFTSSYDLSQASQTWMEHQSLEHIKRALRVTLEWQTPSISLQRKRQSVRFATESFARHLQRLMRIEEEDGYMRMVVDAKPNKGRLIESLRDDHTRFRRDIELLLIELDELGDWQEEQFDALCERISRLLDEVDRHDHDEVRLLQDALLLDEGVGD